MSKRRITKQQRARINKLQQKRLALPQQSTELNAPQSIEREGLLVAHYGAYVDIEDQDGKIYRCNIRQNLGPVVAGDSVIWQPLSAAQGILLAVKPRNNLLSRPSGKGKIKPIAANIDQVIIVIAPEPKPAANLIDSYLVALSALRLTALLICNKSDLIDQRNHQELLSQIALYQHIGYPVLVASAQSGAGINDVKNCLCGQTNIFVGQSGVGKSSLLSYLLPETVMKPISFAAHHGTHTTTTARLYHLASGGNVIDSPGIRDFILWDMPVYDIARGFIEFQPYLNQCKFRDCQHVNEQDCAILKAVADGVISTARLASYHRIINSNA